MWRICILMLGCKGLRYLVELYSVPRTVWMSSGCRFYSRGRWNWDETFLAICLSKEKCLRRRPGVQIVSMHQLKELSDSTQHWGIFGLKTVKLGLPCYSNAHIQHAQYPVFLMACFWFFHQIHALCAWRRQLSLVVELAERSIWAVLN